MANVRPAKRKDQSHKCAHFCSKVVCCGIWDMRILGFVRLVCYQASQWWLFGYQASRLGSRSEDLVLQTVRIRRTNSICIQPDSITKHQTDLATPSEYLVKLSVDIMGPAYMFMTFPGRLLFIFLVSCVCFSITQMISDVRIRFFPCYTLLGQGLIKTRLAQIPWGLCLQLHEN